MSDTEGSFHNDIVNLQEKRHQEPLLDAGGPSGRASTRKQRSAEQEYVPPAAAGALYRSAGQRELDAFMRRFKQDSGAK